MQSYDDVKEMQNEMATYHVLPDLFAIITNMLFEEEIKCDDEEEAK